MSFERHLARIRCEPGETRKEHPLRALKINFGLLGGDLGIEDVRCIRLPDPFQFMRIGLGIEGDLEQPIMDNY